METNDEQSKLYEEQYDKLWEDYESGSLDDVKEVPDVEEQQVKETTDEVTNDEPVESEVQVEDELVEQEQEVADDNTDETQEPTEEEVKKFTLKAIGTELELTEDEMKELAKKGIDYTKKTQELSQWRDIIELARDIPKEELNALRALRDGNKEALVKLAKEHDIDLYDLDVDSEPEIKDYSTNPVARELNEVESIIMADKEVLPEVESVLQIIPEDFKQRMAQEPKMLQGLYVDIKNGVGKKAVAEALKNQALNGGDFLTNYRSAFQNIVNIEPKQQLSQETVSKATKATIPSTRETTQKRDYLEDAKEIWKMPSQDFAKYKAKIMRKVYEG